MFERRSPTILLVIAAAVAAQVGYVGLRERERAQALDAELTAARETHERSLAQLSDKLQDVRAQVVGLRDTLEEWERHGDALEEELATEGAKSWVLREQAQLLRNTLVGDPPFLSLSFAPLDGLRQIQATAENPGGTPLEITWTRGLLFLGAAPETTTDVEDVAVLAPGEELDFYRFSLLGDEPARVALGAAPLRGALCIVYRRAQTNAPEWSAEYWFEYRREVDRFAVLARDIAEVDADEEPCTLAPDRAPW